MEDLCTMTHPKTTIQKPSPDEIFFIGHKNPTETWQKTEYDKIWCRRSESNRYDISIAGF